MNHVSFAIVHIFTLLCLTPQASSFHVLSTGGFGTLQSIQNNPEKNSYLPHWEQILIDLKKCQLKLIMSLTLSKSVLRELELF